MEKPKTTNKNSVFTYEGKDKRGNSTRGEIVSSSVVLAKAELKRQGINPTKVKIQKELGKGRGGVVKPADICAFARQMATMMSAGVPLVQSFDIIARGSDNPAVQKLVLTLKNEVESGRSFSEALQKQPKYFDDLFCNLVAAGEAAGALEGMLDRVALYKEKAESLKKKIKKALFYPTAVVIVAIVVTVILLIYVVPQFESLFKSFGADLPAFTQMVINLSQLMQKWWAVMGLGCAAFGAGFIWLKKRSKLFRTLLDRLVLRLPVVGNILHKAAIARFARTLATTFAAGVPLVEALLSVAGATGNVVYSNAILRIREEVTTGTQLQQAMRQTTIFPNMVVQMIAIGEEAGALDKMLSKVANIYEEEVDAAVDGLSSLLEPLIMAILGVLVGGLVIAMYLPIFKMGSVVS